ncbi:MAG: galactose mutarotase [Rhizobacter sp.]|nr:galactose mutarotase [Rhizobacter sp.]
MSTAGIRRREFGRLADGRIVTEYTLDNGHGLTLSAIEWGGVVTSVRVPDRHGVVANVVLGLDRIEDYVERSPHLGAIVGRFANRIAKGRFELDGASYQLATNDGPNALHGGVDGFGKRWWDVTELPVAEDGSVAIELSRTSPDGEEGYPGTMRLVVRYTLRSDAVWCIDYRAETDRATVVNLSHHDYFNLAGRGSALDQLLTLNASRYTPVDASLIPTGTAPVEGTPLDFRKPTRIADRVRSSDEQIVRARGYDHNWCVDQPGEAVPDITTPATPATPATPVTPATPATQGSNGQLLAFAARLEDPASGRSLEVWTTQPGVQFYSGNFLDATLVASHGEVIRQGDGVCLETQHFPDSPNQPGFPSTVLRPGEVFTSSTELRFGYDA